ncbi:MAG: P-type conjugative transfer protein TrbL [Dermatophilaceae bacterium]
MKQYPKGISRSVAVAVAIGCIALAVTANVHAAADPMDLLDSVLGHFQATIVPMKAHMLAAAERAFWILVATSMVIQFIPLVFKAGSADLGEFFAVFVQFLLSTGLFLWLLRNGPDIAVSLLRSMQQLGATATGVETELSPSNVIDIGFRIFNRVADQASAWSFTNSIIAYLIALVILALLAKVAVNYLTLIVTGWLLAYGGTIVLAFGGSHFTSDMAIGYFKTVFAISLQMLAVVIIAGIGQTLLLDFYATMGTDTAVKDLAVAFVYALVLHECVERVPMIFGGLGGHAHSIGGFSWGAMRSGYGAVRDGLTNTAGAAQGAAGGAAAIIAAVSQGSTNTAAGNDVVGKLMGAIGSTAAAGGSTSDDSGSGWGSGAGGGDGRSLGEQMGGGATGATWVSSGSSNGGGSSAGGGRGGAPNLQAQIVGDAQRAEKAFASGGDVIAASDKRQRGSEGAGGGSKGSAGGGSEGQGGSSGGATGAGGGANGGQGQGDSSGAGGAGRSMAEQIAAGVQGPGRTAGGGGTADGGISIGDVAARAAGGILGAAATVARIGIDAGANLAAGAWDATVAGTAGGRVAAAIKARGAADEALPSFGGDSLAAGREEPTPFDAAAEISAFVNRT